MSQRRCGFCGERVEGTLRPWKGREACDDCRDTPPPPPPPRDDQAARTPWNYFANLALGGGTGRHPAAVPA